MFTDIPNMSFSGSYRILAGKPLVSLFSNFKFFNIDRMLQLGFLKFWDVFQDKAGPMGQCND